MCLVGGDNHKETGESLRENPYNRSHKWQCAAPRKYGTQQQDGSHKAGELKKLVYETGSSTVAPAIHIGLTAPAAIFRHRNIEDVENLADDVHRYFSHAG